MTFTEQQIAELGTIIYETCKDMGVQECVKAQRAMENMLKENPDATKDDIINTVFNSLKENMVSNPVQCMMFHTYGDPNILRVELQNNISIAIDKMKNAKIESVELKDASDKIKVANNFIGEFDKPTAESAAVCVKNYIDDIHINDIFYINKQFYMNPGPSQNLYESGYYKIITAKYNMGGYSGDTNEGKGFCLCHGNTNYIEYLGTSYLVDSE